MKPRMKSRWCWAVIASLLFASGWCFGSYYAEQSIEPIVIEKTTSITKVIYPPLELIKGEPITKEQAISWLTLAHDRHIEARDNPEGYLPPTTPEREQKWIDRYSSIINLIEKGIK